MNISSRARRRLLIAVLLVAVYSLVGFVVLPPLVRSQAEKRASALLGRRVTVEAMRLNPFTLSATLRNFAIWEKDGTTRFVGWRRLHVDFDALSSLFGEWVLSRVELDGLYARGVLNADQSLNCSDLLARLAPPSQAPGDKSKPARPVRVGKVSVTDARIDVSDLSRKAKFATMIGPLNFELTGFRTVAERGAPYRFEAVTEAGERLAWSGTLRAEPFQSAGELRLENIVLSKYAPYYADLLQADITTGTLSVRGRYEIDLTENKRVLTLHDGGLQLRGFALRERGADANALELPAVDITGIQADALTAKATLAAITLTGGRARVRRDANGTVNLLAMVQPGSTPAVAKPESSASPTSSAPPSAPAALPDVTIGEIVAKDFGAEVNDLAAPRAAQLAVSHLAISLKNVSLSTGARIPLQLTFDWAPHGTVGLEGTVTLAPIAADLKVTVANFAVLPLSPYLEAFANVHLTQGAVSTTLSVTASLPEGRPPAATVAGDITVDNLGVVDGSRNEDLAAVGAVSMHGLRAAVGDELRVAIDEISITKPSARVAVAPDGTINLTQLAKTPAPAAATPMPAPATPATPTTPPTTNPAKLPQIEIGKIVVAEGDFRFVDTSLTPGVAMTVNQFAGTIANLSSTNPGKGDVNLKGIVNGDGIFAITGALDPLGTAPRVDLKVNVTNVDLLPTSPYTGKYAGYELARGKLFVDTKVQIDGKKLDSTNVITLNQFTFGGAVQSPDATKLPVRLAIALLKDIDGKIIIDVPVQGSLDDPNLRVGRVVLRVVVNLLTKAAVSPFALLGAAFGGGGDELAYQEFAPGMSELKPSETRKLDTMVKALTNRPGLNLDLEGSYDAAADAYALKRVKLADRVRRAIWAARREKTPNIPPPEQLTITPEENAVMIKQLFDAAFPPGTQFGTPVPPPPPVVAPPAPPPGGWFQRIVRTITRAEKRAEHKAEAENARLGAEHEKAVANAVAAGLPTDEMLGRLAEATVVDENDLRALAQARAQRVRDYLRDVGKISAERLFLAKGEADQAKASKGPRVFLVLQ